PEDVRDLVQDDPVGAQRLPARQGAHPPAPDRRVPAGLRPHGSRQVRQGGAVMDLTQRYEATLDEIREAGLFKAERIITSPQAAEITLADGRPEPQLLANNHPGLADPPPPTQAA